MSVPSWRSVSNTAEKYGAKYPELVAAQWALESSWGKKVSGKNNYFGLKGDGTTAETVEIINGKEVVVDSSFMDFDSIEESIEYLVDRWYKNYKGYQGVNNAADRNAAAQMLLEENYATDPYYADKLIRIMDENEKMDIVNLNDIKLADAAKWYNEEPHQVKAWNVLQASIDPSSLQIFQHIYRGGSLDALSASSEFPLGAPYFYQRNSNTGHGERMCQSSCIAMVLEYIWPGIVDGDDDIWLHEVLKYGDTVSQTAQLDALEGIGVDNVRFEMEGCENDLLSCLLYTSPSPRDLSTSRMPSSA